MSKVDLTQYNNTHNSKLGYAVKVVGDLIDIWEKSHSYTNDGVINAAISKEAVCKRFAQMLVDMIEDVGYSSGYMIHAEHIDKKRKKNEYIIYFRVYKIVDDNVDDD